MRSYVIYGTVEPNKELAIDYEWMHYFLNYVDVYYNDNIGVIYGIKCELNVKNGTSNFTKEHLDEFVNKFMTIYKKKVPDAEYAYFTGIPYEDICQELGYDLYDFEEEEEDEEDDEEEDEEDDEEEDEDDEDDEEDEDDEDEDEEEDD
jgi:hypothetical protein